MRFQKPVLFVALISFVASGQDAITPHATSSEKAQTLRQFAVKASDELAKEKLAKLLLELPKFVERQDRQVVLDEAIKFITPHLSQTYANCKEEAVTFELAKSDTGNHEIKVIEKSEGRRSETEFPFRPVLIDGEFIVAEADTKLPKEAGIHGYLVTRFFEKNGRKQVEIHQILIANGKIVKHDTRVQEQSDMVKCRVNLDEAGKKTEYKFENAKKFATHYFYGFSGKDKKKAVSHLGDYLAEESSPLSYAPLLAALKKERILRLDINHTKNQLAAAQKALEEKQKEGLQSTEEEKKEFAKLKLASDAAKEADLEYSKLLYDDYDARQLREAKDQYERYKDVDDYTIYFPAHWKDDEFEADYDAAWVPRSWGGLKGGYFDEKKLEQAYSALRKRLKQKKSDASSNISWYQERVKIDMEQTETKRREKSQKEEELKKANEAYLRFTNEAKRSLTQPEEDAVLQLGAKLIDQESAHIRAVKAVADAQPVKEHPVQDPYLIIAPISLDDAIKVYSGFMHLNKFVYDAMKVEPRLFEIAKVDPATNQIVGRSLLVFGEKGDTRNILEMIPHPAIKWSDLSKPIYLFDGKKAKPEPVKVADLLNDLSIAYHRSLDAKKDIAPLSSLIDTAQADAFLVNHGLKVDGKDPNVVYMPVTGAARKDALAMVMLPEDAVKEFSSTELPSRLANEVIEREFGKQFIVSAYPLDVLKRESPETLIHERTHLLDRDLWNATDIKRISEAQANLSKLFEHVIPEYIALERKSENYQKAFEAFKAGLPSDDKKISPLSSEEYDAVVKQKFEEALFGKHFENLKKQKKTFGYLKSPTERIAFAVEIAYMRDVKKMTFEQVIEQFNRAAGRHFSAPIPEMHRIYIQDLYENKNLKQLVDRAEFDRISTMMNMSLKSAPAIGN